MRRRRLHDAIFRDIWLFFSRDLRIASTYRSPFVWKLSKRFFAAAMFFYVSRFVDSPGLRASLPQGSSYFAYALVGFVFFDYLHAALDTFDRTLQEARDGGTLVPLLVTQVSLPVVLVGSAIYPFVSTTLRSSFTSDGVRYSLVFHLVPLIGCRS